MIERLLRSIAVAIAVAALLDPPLVVTARQRPRLTITLQRPGDPMSIGVRQRLMRDLRADFEVVGSGPDRDAAAAIVVGDEYPERPAAFSGRTSTVTIDAEHRGATVRIAAVRAPRAVPRGTRIQLEVTLESLAATGMTSEVAVSAGPVGHPDIEVARASHAWATSSRRVVLNLEAMPLGLPPWHLRVRVSDASQPSAVATSDVLVEEATPLRVLFYEPRPSWIATFVRRAVEGDDRFVVGGLEYPSRGIRIASGDAVSLDPTSLRAVSAVVVGGLDRLTVADRDRLDWFVRERGGSLVLLPDARPGAAPWTDWLSGATAREVLLERPTALAVAPPLPAVQASELLTFAGARVPGARVLGAAVPGARVLGAAVPGAAVPGAAVPGAVPGATVVARVAGSNETVVLMVPRGAGRLLVSGALDAWRYRADNGSAFDRFWRSAIAGMALATPPPVDVEIVPAIARPGESVRVMARIHRSALDAGATRPLQVSARLDSGEPIRLWPEAEPDVFAGSFAAGQPGVQRIIVSVGAPETQGAAERSAALPPSRKASADHRSLGEGGSGPREGSAIMAVGPASRQAEPIVPLSLLAVSRGGINVTPDHLADLETYLRREVAWSPVRATTRPMRSGWWIVPFAACLCGEWWLRRRQGLR
jgi:hypothetical protein